MAESFDNDIFAKSDRNEELVAIAREDAQKRMISSLEEMT